MRVKSQCQLKTKPVGGYVIRGNLMACLALNLLAGL